MPNTTELLGTGVGAGAGAGTTLLVRRQFDNTGETTLLRPSVLWGLGSGVAAIAVPYLMPGLSRGMMGQILEDYGQGALTAGVFSAFSPKGGGVQLPTI